MQHLSPQAASRSFWKSAGMHLLRGGPSGWLEVTPDFLRAYYTRPEIHPIETSCAEEVRLHEELMVDPFRHVAPARLDRLADLDAAENYRAVLTLRELLQETGTIEGAYLALIRGQRALPSVFIDQLVHLILRNVLKDATDPVQLRAGELFFREQSVSTEGGRILLADEEIVEMRAQAGSEIGIGQLLAEAGTPMKSVALDVLSEDNKEIYWARSDRFDTVIDFRFEQPAPDAFARVIEAWILHLIGLKARVEPRPNIEDRDWRWHIGLDREGMSLLNALYEGKPLEADEANRIVALFRMRVLDEEAVIERMRGMPIYMALAMTDAKRVKMKPQNLIANLPLRPAA